MARPESARRTRVLRALGILLSVGVGLGSLSSIQAAPRPKPPIIRVAAVGDSITTWIGNTPVGQTWTLDLERGPVVVDQSQGWAVSGARLADMARASGPVTDDYLVIMGGVNDIAHPDVTSRDSMIASVEQIVRNSGLPADRVVVSAIAPLATVPTRVAGWNAEERQLAARFGWHYIDPWSKVRDSRGVYLPKYTLEGLHPNAAGSRLVAHAIAGEIVSLAPGR